MRIEHEIERQGHEMSNVRTLGKHACSAKMPVAWPHQVAFGFSAHLQKAWASQMLHKMPKHYIPHILELVKTHTMHVVFMQKKIPQHLCARFLCCKREG